MGHTTREPTEMARSIYAVYPRKVGRSLALFAIDRALARVYNEMFDRHRKAGDSCTNQEVLGEATDFLLMKTQEYASQVAMMSDRDKKYVPHPSTWFNQERYLDEGLDVPSKDVPDDPQDDPVIQ